ncbi:MAG: ABC transporter permease [Chloroflexi bacterium]|nr:ABC transporter permease [Chloroflexota bacterium]
MSATTTARQPRPTLRVRLRFYSAQNVPLLLSLGLLAAMIVLYIVLFITTQHRAPGGFELSSTLNNTMGIALAAVGQTVVVLTGGIDLSVGGGIDLTNGVAAQAMHGGAGSMLGVTALVLLIGAGAGLINGLLVAYGRLQPIIVTIATLAIWQGVALYVLPQPGGAIPPTFSNILAGTVPAVGNVPSSLIVLALLVVLLQVLRRTPFLVALYAIGNDARAARANGTPVERATIGAYTLGGAFAGAAGLYLAAVSTSGDATAGSPLTLTSIAATVLGGVSLFGGRGSAIGAVAGAFILTLLLNVLFFAGVNQQLQDFFQGLFLVLAVMISTLVGRLLRRARLSA